MRLNKLDKARARHEHMKRVALRQWWPGCVARLGYLATGDKSFALRLRYRYDRKWLPRLQAFWAWEKARNAQKEPHV